MARQRKGPRIGRPPRTDNPARVMVVLPGVMRSWLRAQATREGRPASDILADGLRLYQQRKGGRR